MARWYLKQFFSLNYQKHLVIIFCRSKIYLLVSLMLNDARPLTFNQMHMQGTEIVDQSNDQDTTDLHKCIMTICGRTSDVDKSNVKLLRSVQNDPMVLIFIF